MDPKLIQSILGDSIEKNRKVEGFNPKFKVEVPCTKRQRIKPYKMSLRIEYEVKSVLDE